MAGSGGFGGGYGGKRPPLLSEPFQPTLNFLTQEEIFHTSEIVKSKFLRVVSELSKNFNASEVQRRNDKAAFDQQIFDLESQLRDRTAACEDAITKFENEKKDAENYREKWKSTMGQLTQSDTKMSELEKEVGGSKIKLDQAVAEKEDLLNIVEKRNTEIEKLTKDLQNANEQLQSATVAKIEALAKVDELTSKEIELDYKEKQVEKEREWVSKQVQLLNEELDKKNNEIIEMQREASLKYLSVQTDLSEKTEELRIALMSLENVKRSNEEQEKHIERLVEKLKDAQDMEIKLEENYRQELKSQKKIAELYKESSEEAAKKVEELEEAVGKLQNLLRQSTERYGELETKFSQTQRNLTDEIHQRDKTIESLNKELSDANELLSNIKKQGMTDEMIQSLSPAAAAASSMLKDSHSLTEIFSRYQAVYTELVQTKEENEKLNGYVNQILQEITERAPTLRRQKEDYERCLKTIDALTTQLDFSLQEINDAKIEIGQLRKTAGTMERENNRLKTQLKDMSLQIKSLVKEVELSRGNYAFADPEDTVGVVPDVLEADSPRSSSRVITERLVTFRNIDELQAQNQHLLAVVRELSDAQESSDKNSGQGQLQELKECLETAKAEIEDLKAVKNRQESMIESITQQRDTYSALIKQQRSPNSLPGEISDQIGPQAQEKISTLEKIVAEGQTIYKKLKEEYDTFRKEKNENDKIASEQLERLRDDVTRMRTENAKLASQVEYNNERAKIYTANLETYKKNIAVLDEKNRQYQTTVLKHEQSIETLKTELGTTQQKLARSEVSLSTITQERNVLRDAKARLQAERDLFKREHSTQQMLHVNLEQIKNGLEMANSASRIKLENQVESLQQEISSLRRQNDTENSRFKDTVLAWDKMTKDLQAKLETQEKEMLALKSDLTNSQGIIRTQRKEIEDLLNKVSVLTGASNNLGNQSLNSSTTSSPSKQQTTPVEGGSSQEESAGVMEKKIKDLGLQLIEAQSECRSIKQQFDFAKSSLEEYKMLAQAMEEQLNSANASSKNFSEELTERLACKDDIIRGIQSRLDTVEKENSTLKQEKEAAQREAADKIQYMTEEINRMRRDLSAANSKLQSLVEENCTIKADLDRHDKATKDMQEKYERELALHAQDVKTGGEIKSELDELKGKVDEATRARASAEETLNTSKASWEEQEKVLNVEIERMKTNLEELESLNTSLQDQLINLTNQINSLRHVESSTEGNESADTSLNRSFSENDAKTSEQWLQLIKYLRREKELFRTKAEMAQNTAARLESQLDFLEKQHQEVQKQLVEIQDKSHVSVITSAKQAELLRKVETLSALTDSNRMLREEKDAALKEIDELKAKLDQMETEITPLRVQNTEYENKCEALNTENSSLKQDLSRWKTRAGELLQKSNKVNPEEMKKLQIERDNLLKQLTNLQEQFKKQQQEIARLNMQIKGVQQNLSTQQVTNAQLLSEKKTQMEENRRLNEQNSKFKQDLESLLKENIALKATQTEQETEIVKLRKELERTQTTLEEHKGTVKTIKNIAKKYKKQYEDLLEEQKNLTELKISLEEELAKVNATVAASAASAAAKALSDSATETDPEPVIPETSASDELLKQEIARQELRVTETVGENEALKRDMESVKSECTLKEDRLKLAMKNLREKLNQVNQQKSEAESELNDYKGKLSNIEAANEEVQVRFAALRSQLEGRITKLEKENKDLRSAANVSNAGETSSSLPGTSDMATANANLQEDNNRLKKELDMLRTRAMVLEKQFKNQQQASKGGSSSGTPEKPQTEPPKANIKPIAGTSTSSNQKQQVTQAVNPAISRPLTASIRPMSMQRKATVMPTTAVPTQQQQQQQQQQQHSSSTTTTQQQQQTQSSVPAMFIAPVSQAQVSTSTPDQSSVMEHAHHLPMTSSATTATVTNSTNVRQATVQPTPAVTVAPIASTATIGSGTAAVAPQGQVDRESAETGEDPSTSSTSHMEDLEMGDSSEQVSSSESSHQSMIPVAPIRSQQDQVQQSSQALPASGTHQSGSSSGGSGVEEPSPSTSTGPSTRPTQSSGNKRGRESEVETSEESSQRTDEPESKRTRTNIPMPIEREAEAMAHQQEEFSSSSSGVQMMEEQGGEAADQGGRVDEENQIPTSDTTTTVAKAAAYGGVAPTDSQDDDDSDVIIIDSDDDEEEEEERSQRPRGAHREEIEIDEEVVDEEDEELEEEEEEEEGDDEEDERSSEDEQGGGDIDSDDDDDDEDGGDGDGMDNDNVGLDEEQEDEGGLDHDDEDEGREAKSMEDNEGDNNESKTAPDDEEVLEADTIEIIEEEDLDSQHEVEQDENQVVVPETAPSIGNVLESIGQGTSSTIQQQQQSSATTSVVSGNNFASVPSSSSLSVESPWGQNTSSPNSASARPVPVARPSVGRQERLPSLGRQHQLTPSYQSGHGMFGEEMDDSIVPSTPTLFVPRRGDGFAEVSSPHVPPQRFTFSSPSDTTHSHSRPSESGLDDTRVDLFHDDGTGRSVPTTPLQVSPPVEVADLPSEMDSQGESLETPGISDEIIDVQPSSSDSSRFTQPSTGADIPAITITSVLDSSLDFSPDQVVERPNRDIIHLVDTNLENTRVTGLDMSRPEVASVTSSDEDKVETGTSSGSAQAHQQSAASSSSRTASPTPSTGQQTIGDQTNISQQGQQHRARPVPIVWDQPTSSSSVVPTAPRPMTRGRGMLSRAVPSHPHQIPPEAGAIPPIRGAFRQLRGTPSARRSRPHSRGGTRGAGFGKGPY